jgi:DNA-binding LacI/PurR family transcriptional regulator
MRTHKRPRMIDVARLAGVSPATVSLVVNNRLSGNVRIPPETQQRVLAAVRELGYVADPVAQSLAGTRNRLLGVFTFESIFPVQFRDFYYPFLVGVESAAEALNFDLVLFTSTTAGDGRRRIYRGGANRLRLADGAVLLGTENDKSEVQRLVDEQYPFVFIGRRELPDGQVSYAAADYTAATCELVEHLFALGHRRVAYLGAREANESMTDRRRGYHAAFARNGLPLDPEWLWLQADHDLPAALGHWLRQGVTAVVAESGPFAATLVQTCYDMGVILPTDLSLAFLGDLSAELPWELEATTFAIPRQEMGAMAVRLLAELLAQEDAAAVRQVTLPCRLSPGNSCVAPRSDTSGYVSM